VNDLRPVIGIIAAVEQASYGVWDTHCALTQLSYIQAVQQAGGIALLIPPDPELVEDPDPVLDRIDGLILAGGSDIGPDTYGAEPDPETHGVSPERDQTELAFVRRALERDMPILGICRGMQLLNVACGGTLYQHLPDVVGHGEHRRQLGTFIDNEHEVDLDPGSLAAQAAGEELHMTRSHHHQAIDKLGEGLLVTGRSPFDDVPEAIEMPDSSYVLGVQWHPEADEASRVVASLVGQAQRSKLGSA
jgi:putative glutamine amidotransferase